MTRLAGGGGAGLKEVPIGGILESLLLCELSDSLNTKGVSRETLDALVTEFELFVDTSLGFGGFRLTFFGFGGRVFVPDPSGSSIGISSNRPRPRVCNCCGNWPLSALLSQMT